MNKLAKLSSMVAIASIALLITWCVGLLVVSVFDLTIFKEYTADFLGMAILPILATVAGAALINMISNIGMIADHITNTKTDWKKSDRRVSFGWKVVLLVNLILVGLLFVGDSFSRTRNRQQLVKEMELISKNNHDLFLSIDSAKLEPKTIQIISEKLAYLNATNTKLNNPSIIFECEYAGKRTLCEMNQEDKKSKSKLDLLSDSSDAKTEELNPIDYLYRCDEEMREYLKQQLQSDNNDVFFSKGGKKEDQKIFIKMPTRQGTVLLKMTKYSTRYGHLGS